MFANIELLSASLPVSSGLCLFHCPGVRRCVLPLHGVHLLHAPAQPRPLLRRGGPLRRLRPDGSPQGCVQRAPRRPPEVSVMAEWEVRRPDDPIIRHVR